VRRVQRPVLFALPSVPVFFVGASPSLRWSAACLIHYFATSQRAPRAASRALRLFVFPSPLSTSRPCLLRRHPLPSPVGCLPDILRYFAALCASWLVARALRLPFAPAFFVGAPLSGLLHRSAAHLSARPPRLRACASRPAVHAPDFYCLTSFSSPSWLLAVFVFFACCDLFLVFLHLLLS